MIVRAQEDWNAGQRSGWGKEVSNGREHLLKLLLSFRLSSFKPPPEVSEWLPLSSQMSAAKTEEASTGLLKTKPTTPDCLQEVEMGKKLQGKCLSITSPESRAKLYCCYAVITVLTVAVIVLSVALSVKKTEQAPVKNTYAACPRHWIGFGNKCFHFSESTSNWTFSQTSCVAQDAQLARFDNLEELDFLSRYKGTLDYWIGLHRESPQLPWRWTDNTEYNSTFPIRGKENHAYLNNKGISSARVYVDKRWICSKPNSYTLQCQNSFSSS
ncbi:C-type lectin domain family 2 member D11-like isoform X1 [Meriones unguiculatus]|uniref:C-type lectin domain family 2 member D11-like isoform X1 n=1 Tax=Meriones unguiculatus TaxID=10047 RepID=UPI00293E37B6|nr:C-type lectin domain family 2 member D11-like isoform X1 [Meriones unguiculatus]